MISRYTIISILVILVFGHALLALNIPAESREWLSERDSLIAAVNPESPPFSYLNKKGELEGFDIDLIGDISRAIGKKIALVPLDSEYFAAGEVSERYDLLVGIYRTPENEERFYLSRGIFECEFTIYILRGAEAIDGFNDLTGRLVGVCVSSPIIPLLQAVSGDSVVTTLSPKEGLYLLKNGIITTFISPQHVADHIIEAEGLDEIEKSPSMILKYDYTIAVPRGSPELFPVVDRALNYLERSGKLTKTYSKWFDQGKREKENQYLTLFVILISLVIIFFLIFYIADKLKYFNISLRAEKENLRRLEVELSDLDEQFNALSVAASKCGIGIFAVRDVGDITGKIVRVNEGMSKMSGFTTDELLQKSFTGLFEGEDLKKVSEYYRLRKEGNPQTETYELVGVRADGEKRPIELSVQLLETSEGTLIIGLVKELSRIKTLQKKLRNSDHNFRTTLSSLPNGAIVINRERILYLNNAFRKLVGRSPEDIRTWGFRRLLPPVHRARIEAVVNNLLDGKEAPKEIQFELLGPKEELLLVSSRPRAANYFGEPAVLMVLRENIKRSPGVRTGLSKSKFEGIGNIADDLVLEFNNMLMGVMGAVNNIRLQMVESSPLREYVEIIEKEAERAAELTGKLLSMSRESEDKAGRVISLHAVIRDALELMPEPPEGKIEMVTHLDARPDTTRGNISQIHQAILNLVVHAVESMNTGGTLTIETVNVDIETGFQQEYSDSKPGRYVCVSVADTGPGIGKDNLPDVFQPFFQAGQLGVGAGLGLSLVQKLVKKHGGFVRVESEMDVGSTFFAYFPEDVSGAETAARSGALPKGTETVLVVDDEPHIRTVLKALLEYLGYGVLLASDGAEGVEMVREKGNEIALVLLDIIMPGMNGEEAFKNMREIAPSMKIVISTGYAREDVLSDLIRQGASALIRKPYYAGTIAKTVRCVLDGEEE